MFVVALSYGKTNLFLKKTRRQKIAHATFMLLVNHGNIITHSLGLTQTEGHKVSVLRVDSGAEHFPVWDGAKDLLYSVMEAELFPAETEVIDATL